MIVPTLETEADNAACDQAFFNSANDRFQNVGEMLQIARNHHKLTITEVAKKLAWLKIKSLR